MSAIAIQPLSPDLALPWSPDERQEQAFKRWTKNTFIALLLIFIIVPFLPVFEAEYVPPEREIIKTKVVLEPIEAPPPPPPKPKPKPKVQPKPKPKPKATKPKPTQERVASKPASKPVDTRTALRESTGLSQVSAELNALRGALNVAGMKKKKVTNKGQGVVATVNRNILGENRATEASFGNDIDDATMKSSAVRLASHETTNVEGAAGLAGASTGVQSHGTFKAGQRDMESIRRIFEAKKGAVYTLYNEALSDYPELHGKFIFKLIIQSDGHVTDLALVSSELSMPELERKILGRIAKINFGPADVVATSVEYKFVFFPS
ncbi:AgmX/PglI C-terminal domain-containing protein [Exilibacterium tricleocarpae]|uniref:AgmX/PglI C-terminal domain-containing protein n=1 Tax=Exilibacterium tricleocarpae TaxID=2591008 RepID=A0A545TAI1_9GAMM|nr:AgmX/PglI C-terminal domain-containing protein [Exilibacterium tricleocarpae]TQV74215.1 AgmX/PglI C-terminal domain-containing protein [Exilibacterium tricleocarpae]